MVNKRIHGAICDTAHWAAGSGKSTLAAALITHAQSTGRNVHLFNLDPAAERFEYAPSIDIKDLISLEDVMSEMNLGPNGGLVFCFEYLMENLDWLSDQLSEYSDDYLIIDCPGQLNSTHIRPSSPNLSTFSPPPTTTGCRHAICWKATSSMMSTSTLPSRSDRQGSGPVPRPDPSLILSEANSRNPKFHRLNQAIVQLVSRCVLVLHSVQTTDARPQIDDFSLINFHPLDLTSEESIGALLSHIDNSMQYGEDEEPKEPKDMDTGDFDAE
ncbi:hypothetical protein L7F22_009826 [Adiantum nelumboides]|nr:hypothetical protein [Adiantum nelumboides]